MFSSNLSNKNKKYHIVWVLYLVSLVFNLHVPTVIAGEGMLSGLIPNDGSYRSISFNIPVGTTHTVVKIALDPDADPANEPDFRVYENVSNIPQSFDNPKDLKTVKFGGGPTDNLADVEWYCASADADPCAGDKIIVFRIDHSIRTSGNVSALESWSLEIKNNDGSSRKFFLGIGHSSNTDLVSAISESTTDSEVAHISVSKEPQNFGYVLRGADPTYVPKVVLEITNIGTGDLGITAITDPQTDADLENNAFSRGPVSFPFNIPSFTATPLQVETSFNSQHTSVVTGSLGPYTTNITITSNSYLDGSKNVELSAKVQDLELALLFDVSGSMGFRPEDTAYTDPAPDHEQTRIYQAKLAGQQIQDLLQGLEGDSMRVGLFTFPEQGVTSGVASAATITGLGTLSTVDSILDTAWLISGAGSLQAPRGGWTPMAEGLMESHGTDPGNFGMGKWTSDQYVRRAILMLSDGQHTTTTNSGPPLPDPEAWVGYLEGFKENLTKNIRVYTVAYGNPTIWPMTYHQTLEDLSVASNGTAYVADSLDVAPISGRFIDAIAGWLDWNVIEDPGGTVIKDGPSKTHSVCIDETIDRVAFIVNWKKIANSSVDFILEGPNGVVSASSPDVSVHSSANSATYIVHGETAKGLPNRNDEWTLHLSGGSGLGANESVSYNYSVVGKSNVEINAETGSGPFWTLKDHLFELEVKHLPPEILRQLNVTLEYDIPNESYGKWLSKTDVFDVKWLAQWMTRKASKDVVANEKATETSAGEKQSKHLSETRLPPWWESLGPEATMVHRKVYALTDIAKKPFGNKRTTESITLVDDGTKGDRVAGDGIYSVTLPKHQYDGLARYRVVASIADILGNSCFKREVLVDRAIRVALNPDVIAKNLSFKPSLVLPFFPSDLKDILSEPVRNGYTRSNVVFEPKDAAGNYWGPGHADQINFAMGNAETLGPVVDNLDGSYIQVIKYKKGDVPSVTISAQGVTSKEISMKKPIPKYAWIIVLLIILLFVIFLIQRRKKTV